MVRFGSCVALIVLTKLDIIRDAIYDVTVIYGLIL